MTKHHTHTHTHTIRSAYLAALGYAFIIGFSFLFVKISLRVAHAVDILAYRFTAAFLIAFLINKMTNKQVNISKKMWWSVLPVAIFYPVLFFLFQVIGLMYITTAEAGILQATIPIFTLILATIFIQEKTSRLGKISIVSSVLGVIYIFIMSGVNIESYSFAGVLFILLSTLSIAFYNVFARGFTKKFPLFTLTYYMTFTGFVLFNMIAITYHLLFDHIGNFFLPLTSGRFILAISYLGIFASLLTSFLSNFALAHMEATKMSVFNNLAILTTILAGILFLGESIYYYHVIGAIVIIAGVFGTNYTRKKTQKNNCPKKDFSP